MIKKFGILIACMFLSSAVLFAITDVQNHFLKANKLVQNKKYSEAITEYQNILKIEPKNTSAHILIGLTYATMGDLRQALPHARKAVEIDPSYNSLYHLGLIQALNETPEDALATFDKSLKVNPASSMAHYQKGTVYLSMKKYAEAIKSFREALKLNAQFDKARLGLVAAAYKLKDTAEIERQIAELKQIRREDLAKNLTEWLETKPT